MVSESKKSGHDSKRAEKSNGTLDARIVSIIDDKVTSVCAEGKQRVHTLAKDARVTCDGEAGKTSDLKVGQQVRLTAHRNDPNVAMMVESGRLTPPLTFKV